MNDLAPHVLDNLDARANGERGFVRVPAYMLVALIGEVQRCRATHRRGRHYVLPRGVCSDPDCGQECRIRNDGTVHAHHGNRAHRCPGSHQPPKETT